MALVKKIFFFILIIAALASYFISRDYRSIDNLQPEVFNEPNQVKITKSDAIVFNKKGYDYDLVPVADYKLNALVVHTMDYTWFSINNRDSVFQVDWCLVWGDNVKDGVFARRALSFSQDYRFCNFRWSEPVNFNVNEASNNHLIVDNPLIEKKIKSIKKGDQIQIIGRLVNVKAEKAGQISKYDPEAFSMNTSLSRTDSGAGACEIIYVDGVKILASGHPVASLIFKVSLYLLAGYVILGLLKLFFDIFNLRLSR